MTKVTSTFTKADLRTGMIIELRDGAKAVIMLGTDNGDIFAGKHRWASLDKYTLDLKWHGTPGSNFSADVVKVYQPINNIDYCDTDTKGMNLIWDRNKSDTVELTLAEVAAKIGVDVKQLRIRD